MLKLALLLIAIVPPAFGQPDPERLQASVLRIIEIQEDVLVLIDAQGRDSQAASNLLQLNDSISDKVQGVANMWTVYSLAGCDSVACEAATLHARDITEAIRDHVANIRRVVPNIRSMLVTDTGISALRRIEAEIDFLTQELSR